MSLLHIICASAALLLGPCLFAVRKGTPRHVLIGRAYAISMLGMNFSAFFIYRLFKGFGPFHVLAIVSLLTLLAGYVAFWRRRTSRNWLEHHYRAMNWSYVGLVAAGVSEAIVRIDVLRTTLDGWIGFGIAVFAASLATCLIGGWLIARFEEPTIRRYRESQLDRGHASEDVINRNADRAD